MQCLPEMKRLRNAEIKQKLSRSVKKLMFYVVRYIDVSDTPSGELESSYFQLSQSNVLSVFSLVLCEVKSSLNLTESVTL